MICSTALAMPWIYGTDEPTVAATVAATLSAGATLLPHKKRRARVCDPLVPCRRMALLVVEKPLETARISFILLSEN